MDNCYGERTRKNRQPHRACRLTLPKYHDNSAAKHAQRKEDAHVTISSMPNLFLQDYTRLHAVLHCQYGMKENIMTSPMIAKILTQYHISKGLKVFDKEGVNLVFQELKQLHKHLVIKPQDPKQMSKEEKKAALQYLMFLKQKRCEKIKGRWCADGCKQQVYKTKKETSVPTVAIESFVLSCILDAEEKRDVATADIPGAFMQADIDKMLHMKVEGTMAELLVKLDPTIYRKYVVTEK
eukprot:3533435-Ditylum_brightwellii.AAC.1